MEVDYVELSLFQYLAQPGILESGTPGLLGDEGRQEPHLAAQPVNRDVGVVLKDGALREEMRREGLPEEFVETIETGWWTTCLEILPARERSASKY